MMAVAALRNAVGEYEAKHPGEVMDPNHLKWESAILNELFTAELQRKKLVFMFMLKTPTAWSFVCAMERHEYFRGACMFPVKAMKRAFTKATAASSSCSIIGEVSAFRVYSTDRKPNK